MAKQANRMMIGGFVVVAVVLLAASLVVFGSGKFFKKTNKYVLYFDGSVKGLNVGAPVLFQGVQIGSVESITLNVDPKEVKTNIPVVIDIEPDRFTVAGEVQRTVEDNRKAAKKLVEMGLRAVLTTQSFITGQLMIECDFYPDTQVRLKNINKKYPEFPTIPSTTERLAQTLQKLDLEGMKNSLENTLAGVDRFVNNPDLAAGVRALKDTLEESIQVVKKVDGKIDPLADNLVGTIRDARKLVNNVDRQVDPLAKNMEDTVNDFGRLARDADAQLGSLTGSLDKTLVAARALMSEDAPLIVELENALQAISDAARSIRQLTDNLEQHPEALIQGKGESGGK
jgi:phospholipid/cholesterol/gamma-HCH transport system substrate-binding protein